MLTLTSPTEKDSEDVTHFYTNTPVTDEPYTCTYFLNFQHAQYQDIQNPQGNPYGWYNFTPLALMRYGEMGMSTGAPLGFHQWGIRAGDTHPPDRPIARRLRVQVHIMFKPRVLHDFTSAGLPEPVKPLKFRNSRLRVQSTLLWTPQNGALYPPQMKASDPLPPGPTYNDPGFADKAHDHPDYEHFRCCFPLIDPVEDIPEHTYDVIQSKTRVVESTLHVQDRCYGATDEIATAGVTLFWHQYAYYSTTQSCNFSFDVPLKFKDKWLPLPDTDQQLYAPSNTELMLATSLHVINDGSDPSILEGYPIEASYSVTSNLILDEMS